jgi:hemin uptake protein HemP
MAKEPAPDKQSRDEPTASGDDASNSGGPRLPKIIPFRELCRCGDEVWIENEGELYRLRRTRQGKLILTK